MKCEPHPPLGGRSADHRGEDRPGSPLPGDVPVRPQDFLRDPEQSAEGRGRPQPALLLQPAHLGQQAGHGGRWRRLHVALSAVCTGVAPVHKSVRSSLKSSFPWQFSVTVTIQFFPEIPVADSRAELRQCCRHPPPAPGAGSSGGGEECALFSGSATTSCSPSALLAIEVALQAAFSGRLSPSTSPPASTHLLFLA